MDTTQTEQKFEVVEFENLKPEITKEVLANFLESSKSILKIYRKHRHRRH
jgi:hypothetical protein